MRHAIAIVGLTLLTTGSVLAVSVWQLSRDCGDAAKAYCQGVGYGQAMQDCLDAHYGELSAECRAIVDRIRGGEGVSLF